MPRLPMVPGTRIIDWLFPEGVVTNEEKAGDPSPCECLGDVCFHDGIVGPLRSGDERCAAEKEFEEPIATRVRLFRDATAKCPTVTEGTTLQVLLEDVLPCLCAKLKEGGLEVC